MLSLSHTLQLQGCLLQCGVSLQPGRQTGAPGDTSTESKEAGLGSLLRHCQSAAPSDREPGKGRQRGDRKSRVGWVQARPGAAAGPSLAYEDSLLGLRHSGLRPDRAGHESSSLGEVRHTTNLSRPVSSSVEGR